MNKISYTRAHFRRARDSNSLTYPQFGFKLDDSTLKLSKIGELKLRLYRPVEGRVKTLTISRSPSGKWYVVFTSVVDLKRALVDKKAKSIYLAFLNLNHLVKIHL